MELRALQVLGIVDEADAGRDGHVLAQGGEAGRDFRQLRSEAGGQFGKLRLVMKRHDRLKVGEGCLSQLLDSILEMREKDDFLVAGVVVVVSAALKLTKQRLRVGGGRLAHVREANSVGDVLRVHRERESMTIGRGHFASQLRQSANRKDGGNFEQSGNQDFHAVPLIQQHHDQFPCASIHERVEPTSVQRKSSGSADGDDSAGIPDPPMIAVHDGRCVPSRMPDLEHTTACRILHRIFTRPN